MRDKTGSRQATSIVRKPGRGMIFLVPIIITILAMLIIFYRQLRTDAVAELIKKNKPIKTLFVFSENNEVRFCELYIYNPATNKGAIYYIPGHLGSIIEKLNRVDRISVLYNPQNMEPLKSKIEELLGVEIPFFIDLRKDVIVNLVDLLGGIEVFIPNPVDIDYFGERILLPSGSRILDGDKTVVFLYYEEEHESDLDRIIRKQKFLQSLFKRFNESIDLLSKREPFLYLKKIFNTNFSSRALRSFIRETTAVDAERIIRQKVTGNITVVDGKELLFPHYEGQVLKRSLEQILETLSSSEMILEEELTIGVEVLNGTNINGLASRTAKLFQSFGFEIINVENALHDQYQNTIVLDRKNKPELAKQVADIIRCGRHDTSIDADTEISIDVTVILGKDFDGRYCKE